MSTYNVPAAGSSAPGDALLPSIVRTIVPVVVGLVITALVRLGVSIPNGLLTDVVSALITALYYTGVRFLETHAGPQWGWLLGLAKAPAYSDGGAPSPGAGEILSVSLEADPQAVDKAAHRDLGHPQAVHNPVDDGRHRAARGRLRLA